MAQLSEKQIKELLSRWTTLKTSKGKWLNHWDDLARVMLPRRLGFATNVVEGERRTEDIYDGTPMQASRGLANAIGGLLRPQGLPEVEIQTEDTRLMALGEVQEWLSRSEETLRNLFNRPHARFRQASGEVDHDLVVFGTAALFISESQRRNSLLFQSLHLKDACIFFNEEGAAEGLFLRRELPARVLAGMFGEDRLSEKTRKKLADPKTEDEKIETLHIVIPRDNGRADALMAKDLPIADLWIEVEAKHELKAGGYHELPFVVPRWDTTSGEDYGRSPGMIALPDADTLQAMGETILVAGQRSADPPLAVPNDGSFDAINTFPGGLSYYDVETVVALRGRSPFFPLDAGHQLPIARDMQQDSRLQVWAAFFRNVLNLPVDGPQMTATEVIERKEEFMREIGPIFGRLETDYTAPMVERAFMIAMRSGSFGPIPPVLQGQEIRFEYDSPVRRVRQQIEATAARLWADELLVLSERVPEAIDNVDVDALARFTAEALNIPRQLVRDAESVAAIRQARQEQIQAEQEAAAAQQGVDMAATIAKASEGEGLAAAI